MQKLIEEYPNDCKNNDAGYIFQYASKRFPEIRNLDIKNDDCFNSIRLIIIIQKIDLIL